MGGDVTGNIQCLILSVYVPNSANSGNRLPVMVYIHGGAFIGGSGTSVIGEPSVFVQKDVIVVSINYRLGIYGFMCTESPKAPGNIGLKDQLLALEWVNVHIGSFGGDNSKVTIFGGSAGGMSVHLHLLSDHDKLFDKAIIQSGAATSPWSFENVNNDVAFRTAETLGLVTNDLDEAIDFIAKATVDLAIAASSQIKSTTQYSNEPLTKACVERNFEGVERFVPENPNVAKSEKANTVSVIIGYNSQELVGQHLNRDEEFMNTYSFEGLLEFGFDLTGFDEMVDLIKHFYIGDEAPSETLKNKITSFASDFVFNHPTERAVNLLVESETKAVYHYVFSYVGERSAVSKANTTLTGVGHGEEGMYFKENASESVNDEDQLTTDRMVTMWTNFAKYGNPTPETSELLPVIWEPVSQNSMPYLDIDKNLTLQYRPFHDRMAFWDLFYKLNEGKTKWYNGEV